MSISSEIARIRTAIAAAYSAVSAKGGTVPASATVANLATAIGTISGGATEPYREDTVDAGGYITASVLHGYTYIPRSFFYACTNMDSVTLPSAVSSIGSSAFYGCSAMTLASLPSALRYIGASSFYGCTALCIDSIPNGVYYIGSRAFKSCTGLTEITFEGTPTTIYAAAFEDCTNLAVINVPWSEGEVANAPWGATNATINYDYTGA